jgi:AMP nucleosidase
MRAAAGMRDLFDLPDLAAMDDGIANGTHEPAHGEAQPLALFTGRAWTIRCTACATTRHLAGALPELRAVHQLPVLHRRIHRLGHAMMAPDAAGHRRRRIAFVEPGNVVTRRVGQPVEARTRWAPPRRLPQMPAYHLLRADGSGITMVNIGVGPANAKTITDHIAVLRPHAWLMLGHCAGLRNTQSWATTCWPTPMCARTMCSTKTAAVGADPAAGRNAAGAAAAVAEITQLTGMI